MVKKDTKKDTKEQEEEKTTEKPKKVKKTTTTKKSEKKTKTEKKTKKVTKKETKRSASTKKVARKSDAKKEKKVEKKTKKSTASTKKIEVSTTGQNIGEAIAAKATEEQQWVSYTKIYQYVYQYCEYKNPHFIKTYVIKELERLVEAKLLQQKKRSYKFTKAGEAQLKPAKVPKRSVLRQLETETEEQEEEPKKETFTTQSGRVVTKIVY